MMVDICVIMSVYNEPLLYVKQSVESILNQTKHDFKFVIVCDNPRRLELIEFLDNYRQKDQRIVLFINLKNSGLAKSLNTAFRLVEAKYYARMDADDIAYPMRLERQFEYMEENPTCDIHSSCRTLIDDMQVEIRQEIPHKLTSKDMKKVLLKGCPITHPTIMVRREVYQKLAGYRDLPVAEDYDFYLRALNAGFTIEKTADVLLSYRINPASLTHSNVYKTICLTHYIQSLYRKRLKGQEDSYSKEGVNEFVNRLQLDNPFFVKKRNAIWEKFKAFQSQKNYISLLFLLIRTPWLLRYVAEGIVYKYTLNKFRKVSTNV